MEIEVMIIDVYWLFLVQDDNQLFRTLNKLVNKIIKSKNAIIYTF